MSKDQAHWMLFWLFLIAVSNVVSCTHSPTVYVDGKECGL